MILNIAWAGFFHLIMKFSYPVFISMSLSFSAYFAIFLLLLYFFAASLLITFYLSMASWIAPNGSLAGKSFAG